MKDPFFNGGGDFLTSGSFVSRINIQQERRQQMISHYKNDLAVPGLHIVDKDVEFVPVIIGEDGQEMTYERRKELMKGKPTMFDKDGNRVDFDYRDAFEIDTEPIGTSTQKAAEAEGYRIVKARELELAPLVDADTIAAIEGETILHKAADVNCVYTTGGGAARDLDTLVRYLRESFNRIVKEIRARPTTILMSSEVYHIVHRWLKESGLAAEKVFLENPRLLGIKVKINNDCGECIRVVCDYGENGAHPVFASVFVDEDQYANQLAMEETADG